MSRTHPSSRLFPALTRRGFLEQLGAIGGSSLVFSAMTSLDLMAGSAGQKPELSGRPAKSKVLVLGGGLSGMVVGYELGKLGYDYQVLEARERVGGLQWAVSRGTEHTEVGGERQVCAFDEGQYINVGPWRIPYSHEAVLNYCRELNVPVQVFLNESDANYFYFEGNGAGPLSNKKVRLREIKADVTGQINELFVKALDQQKLDLPLTADDQKRIANYLSARATSITTREPTRRSRIAVRAIRISWRICCAGRSRSGCDRCRRSKARPRRRCSSRSAAWIRSRRASSARWTPKRITFNAEVQKVLQSDTGVKVTYLDTKSKKPVEVNADYVVLCMPLNLVARLDINISDELMQEVKAVNYSNSAKMGLADEAPVLGGGRPHLRRPSLLEPADRRVLVSVVRLLHEEGRAARPVCERAGRQPPRSAGRGARRARVDAREQGAPADSH